MEAPRSIHRFLFGLLMAFTLAAAGASVYMREPFILLGWLAALILGAGLLAALGLLNAVMLAPLLWIVGKRAHRPGPAVNGSPPSASSPAPLPPAR